jgi:hypothetical protein
MRQPSLDRICLAGKKHVLMAELLASARLELLALATY